MATEMNKTMDELNADSKLEAWCEWRKWCSVLRVKDPQPTQDELAAGKKDTLLPETRWKYHLYLRNCIFHGVKKLDKTLSAVSIYEFLYQNQNQNDFLSFFDELMNGKMPRIKGIYKNYVFEKAERSAQPPLKVIQGKIIGPVGYIRDIVKKYLRLNDSGASAGPQSKAIINIGKKVEQDARISEDSNTTYGDLLTEHSKEDPQFRIKEDPQFRLIDFDAETVEMFCKQFTLQELAILLACVFYELPTTSPELHAFVGKKKSAINDCLPNLMGRLRLLSRKYNITTTDVNFVSKVEKWIFLALEAEKTARPLLKVIEARKNAEQQKRDAAWKQKNPKELEESENE